MVAAQAAPAEIAVLKWTIYDGCNYMQMSSPPFDHGMFLPSTPFTPQQQQQGCPYVHPALNPTSAQTHQPLKQAMWMKVIETDAKKYVIVSNRKQEPRSQSNRSQSEGYDSE